jgi:bacterial/archaeal transporter family protein
MTLTLLLLTVFFWGIAPIFDKEALKTADPYSGMVIRGAVIGIASVILGIFGGKFQYISALPGRTLLYFVISGFCAGVIGVFTYFKVLQFSPTSKIVPLAATYPLLTAFLGVVILGENVTVPRLLGVILISAGIFLVK